MTTPTERAQQARDHAAIVEYLWPEFAESLRALADDVVALVAENANLGGALHADHHVVDVHEHNYALQHAVECRPNMLDCPLQHAAGQQWTQRPATPGRYRVDLDQTGQLVLTPDDTASG